jgi:hypothetical protein
MNDVLKIGLIWIFVSIPLIYFIEAESWRIFLVATIGVALTIIGFIINEYQCYKFEKDSKVKEV